MPATEVLPEAGRKKALPGGEGASWGPRNRDGRRRRSDRDSVLGKGRDVISLVFHLVGKCLKRLIFRNGGSRCLSAAISCGLIRSPTPNLLLISLLYS